MDHWWNDSDRGKPKYWEKILSQQHFLLDYFILFGYSVSRQSLVGQALLIIEALLSHSGTPWSVALLWTTDQLVAETST